MTRMTKLVLTATLLGFLVAAEAGRAASDLLPERDLRLALDFARLSEASYRIDYTPIGDATSGYWNRIDGGREASGLDWTLFQRRGPNGKVEHALVFAGTEMFDRTFKFLPDLRDATTDLDQAGSVARDHIPEQYRDALRVAQRWIDQADRLPNTSLVLARHSLGGGITQYVSFHTGVRGFVYNSAPLSRGAIDTGSLTNTTRQRLALAENNIVNISNRRDAVAHWPGLQLGRRHEIDSAPGLSGGIIGWHDIGNLLRSLENAHEIDISRRAQTGPTPGRIVRPDMSGVSPLGLVDKRDPEFC